MWKYLTAVNPTGKREGILNKEEIYPCYSPTVNRPGPKLNKTMFLVLLENIHLVLG